MDAIGFALIGIGSFLIYEAYKGGHPWTDFLLATGLGKSSSSPTINAQGGSGTAPYGPAVP